MRKSKYQLMLDKNEERKHMKELIQDYKDESNKWEFLKEHNHLFATAGIVNINHVFFNNQQQIDLNSNYLSSATFVAPSFSFLVPYKISFMVTNSGGGGFPLIFIRDSIATPASQGTTIPDPSNGNMFMFGEGNNKTTVQTQTSGGVVVDYSFGTADPAISSCIITVSEQVANTVQINVFNGSQYNTQIYTTVPGVFSTIIRDIGAFINVPVAGYVNSQFNIVKTVPW